MSVLNCCFDGLASLLDVLLQKFLSYYVKVINALTIALCHPMSGSNLHTL